MAEEFYGAAVGSNLTALQTVQTQNCVDWTLSGNTLGTLALLSSGTVTFVAGTNITLSQSANHVTILGPSFADQEVPSGALNGTNTTYQLAHAPTPGPSLLFVQNGSILISGTNYTLNSVSLTIATAPASNATLRAWYRY